MWHDRVAMGWRSWTWALLCAGLVTPTGCYRLGPFECTQAEQCIGGSGPGICAEPGYCAFEDDACPSGFRFDDLATAALAGQCVDPVDDSTSTSTSTSSGTQGDASSSSSASGPQTSSSGDADDSTGTVNLCGDRPCACAVDIAAGVAHTCVLRDDASVVCWGNEESGELGRGEVGGAVPWPQTVELPPGVSATSLFVGERHSCVVGDGGALYCWGRNAAGEVDPRLAPGPVPLPTEATWVPGVLTVGAATLGTCAATRGETQCWGDNEDGQLGDAMAIAGPAVVGADMPLLGLEELVGGDRHVCGRIGGDVWCWGTDFDGQLGNDVPLENSATPVMALLSLPARQLAAGAFHTCATLGDETRVQCWGSGGAGQIGTGDSLDTEVPLDIMLTLEEPVVQLEALGDHTCALTQSGRLYCWGNNPGDVFLNGGAAAPAPVEVPIGEQLPEPIERVAMGIRHICAITEGGHVFCWGQDDLQQLGPFDPPLDMDAVELALCDES